MDKKSVAIIMLALAIFPFCLIQQAKAQSVQVMIGQDSVTVNMSLVLAENLTFLPIVNIHIGSTNSTSVSQPITSTFNKAIQALVPSARVTSLDVRVKTSNTTSMWFLEDDYSIVIAGANANSGSRIQSNLAFIPMNISQSLSIGGTEFNAIGPILLPSLTAIAASSTNIQYFIDGSQTRSEVIPAQTTQQTWLLDLHWVTPVSQWNSNSNLLGQSTSWSFSPTLPRYNLTMGLISPEGLPLKVYSAIYNPSITINLPTNAWVNGNTVSFDNPAPGEIAMPVIALTSLIIGLAASFADWRISGQIRFRKKKR